MEEKAKGEGLRSGPRTWFAGLLGRVGASVRFAMRADVSALPTRKKFVVLPVRLLAISFSRFFRTRSALHAAGLTYFSLMSLAPAICLILLLARMCGVGDMARNHINGYIDTIVESVEKGGDEMPEFLTKAQDPELAESKRRAAKDFAIQARAALNGIFDRIVSYDVRAMGCVGLMMLLWTVVSMLCMVESSLNEVWEIPRQRPFLKRLFIYTVMAFVLPALFILAASMPVLHLMRHVVARAFAAVGFEGLVPNLLLAVINSKLFGWLVSLFLTTTGFAFFLSFMPNRHIPLRHAAEGGLVTAFIFGCWLKLCAIAQVGIYRGSAMYGSFAVLPILLTWICISWQIILFGGSMTYAFSELRSRPGDAHGGARRDLV